MTPASLSFAIVGHMVGDYLLQNDWMATGKKRSHFVCAVHALVWTGSVCMFSGWWTPAAFAVLFATHFLQDRYGFVGWWMRTMRQKAFAAPPLAPWSMIVVDNTFHLVVLALVARFL